MQMRLSRLDCEKAVEDMRMIVGSFRLILVVHSHTSFSILSGNILVILIYDVFGSQLMINA